MIHDTSLPSYIESKLVKLEKPGLSSYCVKIRESRLLKRADWNNDVKIAVVEADIVQEPGPENASFETPLWLKFEQRCPLKALLLCSSTSGIPASIQLADMKEPSRLVGVYPYNPSHILHLLDIVPTPITNPDVISRTFELWKDKDRRPLVLKKETTGFVANNLAYALLREAIHLIREGVPIVKDIDDLRTAVWDPDRRSRKHPRATMLAGAHEVWRVFPRTSAALCRHVGMRQDM